MKKLITYAFLLTMFCGCATWKHQRSSESFQQEIAMLRAELQTHPNDPRMWRDLGVAYFETKQYQAARRSFFQAFKLEGRDPRTLFYLGMALELENRTNLALAVYQSYGRTSRFSSFRGLMKARYYYLTRQMLQADMRALLRQESEISTDSLAANALAVFPLLYQGRNAEYAALSKGLAEMLITDLSQVKQLEVIDRVRVQALFDEMALGQSGLVDESTAAKFGRMIRAGRVVRGAYNVLDKNQLRLDLVSWDVKNQQFPEATTHADLLKNLFQLEKDLVFQVVLDMGIELTEAEREKIQRIPTQNLKAFLAYCNGLAQEDAGEYRQATLSYLKAAQLDPDFSWAVQKAEMADDLRQVSGNPEAALAGALTLEEPDNVLTLEGGGVVDDRLENLAKNIDSNFEPGQDSRDATDAGLNLPLRRPPPPPQ